MVTRQEMISAYTTYKAANKEKLDIWAANEIATLEARLEDIQSKGGVKYLDYNAGAAAFAESEYLADVVYEHFSKRFIVSTSIKSLQKMESHGNTIIFIPEDTYLIRIGW